MLCIGGFMDAILRSTRYQVIVETALAIEVRRGYVNLLDFFVFGKKRFVEGARRLAVFFMPTLPAVPAVHTRYGERW